LAALLCTELQLRPEELSPAARARVHHYYLPVYLWLREQLAAHEAAHGSTGLAPPPALVLGLSAPQGCGKTTLVACLAALLRAEGVGCAAVSLDDFYLTGEQQDALGERGNPLLRYRGLPGTHDLALAATTLGALRGLSAAGGRAAVPSYDKSLRQGRGDRAPASRWPEVAAPLRVVLLEGWSLGFAPLGDAAAAAAVHEGLPEVDAALAAYPEALERFADAWLVVRVAQPSWVFDWRLQAELQMRAQGKPGLSDDQVADFVGRFMPAYKAYLPALYANGPTGRPHLPRLAIDVDATRTLVGAQSYK
jgi:D-glycerate 3-kinase